MDNKRERKKILIGAAIGALAGAAVTYGLYSHFSSRNQRENHQAYSSGQEREIRFHEDCPICFETMPIATFACKHSFHKKCIRPWQESNGTCPVCRADLN